MQYHPPETAELAAIREREREIGVPLDYQRDMANAAPGSALRLQEIGRLVRSDQAVPPQVAAMAALGAVLAEDCVNACRSRSTSRPRPASSRGI